MRPDSSLQLRKGQGTTRLQRKGKAPCSLLSRGRGPTTGPHLRRMPSREDALERERPAQVFRAPGRCREPSAAQVTEETPASPAGPQLTQPDFALPAASTGGGAELGAARRPRAPLVKWLLRRPPGNEERKAALFRKENDMFPEEILGRSLSRAARNCPTAMPAHTRRPPGGRRPARCPAGPRAARTTGVPRCLSPGFVAYTSVLPRLWTPASVPRRAALPEAAQRLLLRAIPPGQPGSPIRWVWGAGGPGRAGWQQPGARPARGPRSTPQAVAIRLPRAGCSGSANTRPPAP